MMNWCLMSSDVMRHIRDKLWPMPKHGAINLYVHGNQKVRLDGQPRTSTSTLTQLLNYEQKPMNWCLMSSDVMRHIRDKLWPMPKHGAINLYVHGNPGRPPRLSHSSWTMHRNLMMNWCLMSSDVSRHIRDKLWPMPKHGAINLYVHGNQKAR